MAYLEMKSLESGYGEVQILWGVSLNLEQGQLTTLVGTNGSGKTTLLRTLMGLLPTLNGSITFESTDITRHAAHEKAEMGLALIPEGRQLFTDMTILENLEMGATPGRARRDIPQNMGRVFELFPRLKERSNQIAGTLSGGEQQMLAIGRGLMSNPKIMMFDEPSLGLSPLFTLNLFQIIRNLKNDGITMLVVEQNVQMALAISDYAYVMNNGKIEIEGPAAQVREMESVRKAYLGL